MRLSSPSPLRPRNLFQYYINYYYIDTTTIPNIDHRQSASAQQ